MKDFNVIDNKKIILYGASTAGEVAFTSLGKYGVNAEYFIDSDYRKWGKTFCDKPILSPSELKKEKKGRFVVLITSSYIDEISESLTMLGLVENIDFFGNKGKWKDAPVYFDLGGQKIVINLSDYRAFSLLTRDISAQKQLVDFWINAVQVEKPDIVIDVGVNYGEAIFSAIYPENTQIYGIEANPKLIPYIKTSRRIHPNQNKIKIFNRIASDEEKDNLEFFIDRESSGTSSQLKIKNANEYEVINIKSMVVDNLFIQEELKDKKVLFKIDVEGYEYKVLRGMKNIINSASSVLGYIEIDNHLLHGSKTNVLDYLNFLDENFYMFLLQSGYVNQVGKEDVLEKLNSTDRFHSDLILRNKFVSG